MKVRRIKRSFTLIEVLLALSLLSFVLFFFLGHLKTFVKLKARLQQAESVVTSRALLSQRLETIFSGMEKLLPSDDSCFYSTKHDGKDNLHFRFDAGIDFEKAFSKKLEAELCLKNNQLILKTTSNDLVPNTFREEVLMDGVNRMKTTFYTLPNPFDQDKKKIQKSFKMESNWEEDRLEPPAILHLTLTLENGKELEYTFFPNPKIKEITFSP